MKTAPKSRMTKNVKIKGKKAGRVCANEGDAGRWEVRGAGTRAAGGMAQKMLSRLSSPPIDLGFSKTLGTLRASQEQAGWPLSSGRIRGIQVTRCVFDCGEASFSPSVKYYFKNILFHLH